MGGLPSQAWSEAVDAIYEAGVCICAAAGNHVGIAPPRTLVYPARYPRVIAVCGVMADGSPYADLKGNDARGQSRARVRDGRGHRRLHAQHSVGALRL